MYTPFLITERTNNLIEKKREKETFTDYKFQKALKAAAPMALWLFKGYMISVTNQNSTQFAQR